MTVLFIAYTFQNTSDGIVHRLDGIVHRLYISKHKWQVQKSIRHTIASFFCALFLKINRTISKVSSMGMIRLIRMLRKIFDCFLMTICKLLIVLWLNGRRQNCSIPPHGLGTSFNCVGWAGSIVMCKFHDILGWIRRRRKWSIPHGLRTRFNCVPWR